MNHIFHTSFASWVGFIEQPLMNCVQRRVDQIYHLWLAANSCQRKLTAILGTVTLTPIALSLALPAFFLRALNIRNRKGIIFHQPSQRKALQEEIKILTNNICLSEAHLMCSLNHMHAPEVRIAPLTQWLLKERPMILCLQEAFHTQLIVRWLFPALKTNGFSITYVAAPRYTCGINSGLLIASLYPITWTDFYPFKNLTGIDRLSNKGILLALLQLKEKTLLVANAHFNDPFAGCLKAKKYVLQRAKMIKADQTLFLGDFNTQEKILEPEFIELVDKEIAACGTVMYGEAKCIDRFFFSQPASYKYEIVQPPTIQGAPITDHKAVAITLRLENDYTGTKALL